MFVTPAFAQGAGPAGGSFIVQLLPIIMIFMIVYFLILRPQQKRMKEHKAMVANLKRGDTVVTAGGLIGKVTKVDDEEIQVELSRDNTVTVVRSTIADVRSKTQPAKAS